MARSAAELDRAFRAVFNNGQGEVGLEVGVDPGLPESDYIRIPRSMAKVGYASIVNEPANIAAYVAHVAELNPTIAAGFSAATPIAAYPGTPAGCAGLFGWFTGQPLYVAGGETFAQIGASRILVDDFKIDPPNTADVHAFWTVNQGHINEAHVPEHMRNWVHAVRFWSVVAGFVTVEKNTEFVFVDVPANTAAGAVEFAEMVVSYAPNAFTAAAARAGTWRKTNHATGGTKVSGFARRWLQKEGYLSTAPDQATKDQEDREATTAFYVATHAVSCHAVLALMAPGDAGHWAKIGAGYGFIKNWSVKSSVSLRLEPKTQVAGGAMVADSFEVLKMVIREGLAPLLNHSGEADALLAQVNTLRTHGVACATYAGWFLDGHPNAVEKQAFTQKDSNATNLIGELGHVAGKYYKNTTIGASPALASAATQLGDHIAEDAWTGLANKKKSMSADQIIKAYEAVRGGSTTSRIQDILSDDVAEVRTAVAAYNADTTNLATRMGVANPALVSDATVIRNRGLVVGNPSGPAA